MRTLANITDDVVKQLMELRKGRISIEEDITQVLDDMSTFIHHSDADSELKAKFEVLKRHVLEEFEH